MFKKKSELSFPPLPVPPTNDQIIEDIKGAATNDPVFVEGSSKKMFEECSELDLKFESVKEFIEANHTLKNLLKETEQKLQEVQKNRDELREMAESIKLKAAKALES
ncbi:UPF0449 protein C19orf25 homolog [Macrosteles quadrilineatus]|uniref:UPF0449 protein C19orf25 homolog n=1 Tax=Macrosteles quadrilineatus TaxID=74068 RepID=UPI0023E2B068|nr:UPF0449 protein C19orf25 homolog [Macrosteles quadrilineatus]XP_054285043.1 UPF0449 protein C19orf25 homolog [Macrosteles quadrilineatus]